MLAKAPSKTFHCLTWKPTIRGEPITRQNWIYEQKKKKKGSAPIRLRPDGSVRLPSNARLRASNRTVGWEINAFKSFLAWAKRKGVYHGDADLFIFKNGKSSRRSAFTSLEYNRITSVMRRKSWMEVGEASERSTIGAIQKNVASLRVVFSQYGCASWGGRIFDGRILLTRGTRTAKKPVKCGLLNRIPRFRNVEKSRECRKLLRLLGSWRQIGSQEEIFPMTDDFIWCDEDWTSDWGFPRGVQ